MKVKDLIKNLKRYSRNQTVFVCIQHKDGTIDYIELSAVMDMLVVNSNDRKPDQGVLLI